MLRKLSLLLTVVVATFAWIEAGHAQATRTWISGVGDDANPCSRTAPCKTFAGAISKTSAGGEIDNLDTGGYGALTITKSITLDGGGGAVASVLVAGTPGITIAAGATDVVIIRNLQFQGLLGNGSSSGSGTIGINITGAKTVLLEHDKIDGFSGAGISDARTGGGTRLIIRDTIVENNGGAGVAAVAGATNSVVLENVASIGNKYGVAAATGNNVVVSRSVLSASTVAGVEADPGAQVLVDNTEITHNIVAGVQANGTIVLGNSDIAFNTTGITGAATSFGNNRIFGNAAPGTTPTAGAATTDHGQE